MNLTASAKLGDSVESEPKRIERPPLFGKPAITDAVHSAFDPVVKQLSDDVTADADLRHAGGRSWTEVVAAQRPPLRSSDVVASPR